VHDPGLCRPGVERLGDARLLWSLVSSVAVP
jgi:hypothetical protein